jgi:septal ring-binding cell division protein DamX
MKKSAFRLLALAGWALACWPALANQGLQLPGEKAPAALLGSAPEEPGALFDQALRYFSGAGVAQNNTLGLAYLRRAAQGGHREAQFNLGNYFNLFEKDYTQAGFWWRQAAQRDHAESLYNLAELLRAALIKPQPADDMLGFYRRAAVLGYAPAAQRVAELARNEDLKAPLRPATTPNAVVLAQASAVQPVRPMQARPAAVVSPSEVPSPAASTVTAAVPTTAPGPEAPAPQQPAAPTPGSAQSPSASPEPGPPIIASAEPGAAPASSPLTVQRPEQAPEEAVISAKPTPVHEVLGEPIPAPESTESNKPQPQPQPARPPLPATQDENAVSPHLALSAHLREEEDKMVSPPSIANAVDWPDEHFSLQLIASPQRSEVVALAAAHAFKRRLLLLSFVRDGKTWHALLYGHFPALADARRAREELPRALLAAAPWPRRIGDARQLPQAVLESLAESRSTATGR